MAPLKLYSSPLSFNSLRPEMVLEEKGITDYELIQCELMTGGHKTPDFLTKSAFGNVPLLETSNPDLTIYESRAIARYLAEKYQEKGTDLIPQIEDETAFALFEQGMSIETMKIDPYGASIVFYKIIGPALGAPTNDAIVAKSLASLDQNLKIIDEQLLSKQDYIGGHSFTLADINMMPILHMCLKTNVGGVILGKKNVKAWWDRVTSRPSFKKIIKPLDEVYQSISDQIAANRQLP